MERTKEIDFHNVDEREISCPEAYGTLLASYDALLDRVKGLEGAIAWALGENGDFRERGPKEGAYWWRKQLRIMALLAPPATERSK